MSTIPFHPRGAADADASTLTDRQRLILEAIRSYQSERGFSPSFRDIGGAAGLKSPSSVKHQLQVLEEKGFIRLNANKGRAIEILGPARNVSPAASSGTSRGADGAAVRTAEVIPFPSPAVDPPASVAQSRDVPLVGRIAAGVPITAEQHVDDVMRLPERLTGPGGNLFMLEVHGDSMIDAAICDGDFVVVREQQDAVNGDIVAALLDGEATVKTYRREGGHLWLMPHNPAYPPIDGTHATIMGRVVTVLRKL
ncbi:transcriptional repressor LexA [Bifidobacterium platyrrhinorum]|uniref:LexA repressor n=1 Tax=Bifidobacterium platyrrhinorum TaxID=2661628 RepID=A0A6L9ST70_9BIFI|nr:transcriptional repressor LexA [Bifidobacterium platyrrhinorum]NEG54371.1 transcriptional repressor LexA [Bifidobacterium platyrrhinorum]